MRTSTDRRWMGLLCLVLWGMGPGKICAAEAKSFPQARQHYAQGYDLYQKKKYPQAIQAFERAQLFLPPSGSSAEGNKFRSALHFFIGLCHLAQKDASRARQAMDKVEPGLLRPAWRAKYNRAMTELRGAPSKTPNRKPAIKAPPPQRVPALTWVGFGVGAAALLAGISLLVATYVLHQPYLDCREDPTCTVVQKKPIASNPTPTVCKKGVNEHLPECKLLSCPNGDDSCKAEAQKNSSPLTSAYVEAYVNEQNLPLWVVGIVSSAVGVGLIILASTSLSRPLPKQARAPAPGAASILFASR